MRAMAVNPHVQKRAQAEIDTIIGRGRLPNAEDWLRGDLVYTTALMKEVLRTGPPVPNGQCLSLARSSLLTDSVAIPHTNRQDDTYKGYFIPKGTMIIPNIWCALDFPGSHACISSRT
jgi:cytochrome P450